MTSPQGAAVGEVRQLDRVGTHEAPLLAALLLRANPLIRPLPVRVAPLASIRSPCGVPRSTGLIHVPPELSLEGTVGRGTGCVEGRALSSARTEVIGCRRTGQGHLTQTGPPWRH